MSEHRFHLTGCNLLLAVAALAIAWSAFACGNISAAAKASFAPAKTTQAPGRLIILRAPNIGPQIVGLDIDGVQTALITYNRRYDASLAAGPHVLTVFPLIGRWTVDTKARRLMVEPGKTYTFTATWKHVGILLQ
jgi:hypothetical protein